MVRRRIRGAESESARETRMAQHVKGARVVVVGGGLAGYSAAIEAATYVVQLNDPDCHQYLEYVIYRVYLPTNWPLPSCCLPRI